MKKIILICFYFGKWPRDFNIFLGTCLRNNTIDFLFLTDCVIPSEEFPNIKFIKINLKELSTQISKKLNLKINITRGMKLCDYRPAFGEIFETYIKGYDFWGYSDLDIVYGNIRNFLTDKILDNYDIISVRKEFLSGFFAIYKNDKLFNEIYKRGKDNKYIFLYTMQNFMFEECGKGLHQRLFNGESINDLKPTIDSMTHILKRSKDVRVHFETISCEQKNYDFILDRLLLWRKKNWCIDYNNGILYDNSKNKEIIFFHSVLYKHFPSFYIPVWKEIPDKFKITDKGFVNLDNESFNYKVSCQYKRIIYFIKYVVRIYTKKGRIYRWGYLQCFLKKKYLKLKNILNIN